ncbi:MAG TPA: ATP-binding cassette domain-containing protein [Gammaproteobacteria bacterium]|nr:ATP-binding cassette domain-containing protein [Gammaproteobacteria bacterium]
MFELHAVSFDADGQSLLQCADLRLDAGRVYGLIGHNGSGKSTLLKLLARQQRASRGSICLNGRPLGRWGCREFAREVAYLPQTLPGANHLTARELVAFGRYPWHGLLGRMGPRDDDRIERAMALTDTTGFAARAVDSLSGGEAQRVWLAMLLAQGSRFLLLDEPLSALDVAHQTETLNLVRALCGDLGIGVVIALHDVNLVSRYCDQIIALRHGEVLANGSPAQLMCGDTLEAIYGVPMHVLAHPADQRPVAVI